MRLLKKKPLRKKFTKRVISQSFVLLFITGLFVLTAVSFYFANNKDFLFNLLGNAESGASYYVDCESGSDDNQGTTQSGAWKTLEKVNNSSFSPGDVIYLMRNCIWREQLVADWAGTESNPIRISAYGTGDLPAIHYSGNGGSLGMPGSYVIAEYLKIYHEPADFQTIVAECEDLPLGNRNGVQISGHHNTVRDSIITGNARGVYTQKVSYDNKILNNQIINNNAAYDSPPNAPHWRGGTGIQLEGDRNEVAFNHFEGNAIARSCSQETLSIEVYNSNGAHIHHNTSYTDRIFAEIGRSDNTKIAYNLFVASAHRTRFVVTQGFNDIFWPVTHTKVYNNTTYQPGDDGQSVVCAGCNMDLFNNIFVAGNKALFVGGADSGNPAFYMNETNNIFWQPSGNLGGDFIQNWTIHSTSKKVNPQFIDPVTKNFRLTSTSPAINAGKVLAEYNRDLENYFVPEPGGTIPDAGVYEYGSNSASEPTVTPILPDGGVNEATTELAWASSNTRTVGTEFDTWINIRTSNSVSNADLAFTYDSSVLHVVQVVPGNHTDAFMPNATVIGTPSINNEIGRASISFYRTTPVTGDGTWTQLVRVKFRTVGEGTSTQRFDPASTIIYGAGIGNTVAANGLKNVTYTVSAPVMTPTPTTPIIVATSTPVAPTNTPIPPTATPTPIACNIQSARWSVANSTEGTMVTLSATTNGVPSCIGKQVTFEVRENDSVAEGGLDDEVGAQPGTTIIEGQTVNTTWVAQWQNDCAGFCNEPEYFFQAYLAGESTRVRSDDPLLSVTRSSVTPVLMTTKLPFVVKATAIPEVSVQVRSSEGSLTKKVTLSSTATGGVYSSQLFVDLDPTEYDVYVKIPGFLRRKFTVSVVNPESALHLTSKMFLAGDVNNDNIINTLDIGQLQEEYSPVNITSADSDISHDDKVNAIDLGLLLENYFVSGE